ncbi:MAG TPA: hypothetical protein PK183_07820, partial [Bacillota bacterium]|nr:hypothetical protein [Bacillota bacterium]
RASGILLRRGRRDAVGCFVGGKKAQERALAFLKQFRHVVKTISAGKQLRLYRRYYEVSLLSENSKDRGRRRVNVDI